MTDLTFYTKEDRPWPNPRLTKAAIVGHTTETSTRIWVRCADEGTFWLAVTKKGALSPTGVPKIVEGGPSPSLAMTFEADDGTTTETPVETVFLESRDFRNDTDRTAVFDVNGLDPGQTYAYAVFADGPDDPWQLGRESSYTFRTRRKDPDKVTFGLYSCHMPYKGRDLVNIGMWKLFGETLADQDADFVIGGGDQVYSDGNNDVSIFSWLTKPSVKRAIDAMPSTDRQEIMQSWYRDIYRGYWGPLDLRRVLRAFPTYMIWDDHEIMDGWGSYGNAELSNHLDTIWQWENTALNVEIAHDMFAAATSVYKEYQHCHNPVTADGQFDYPISWGPCALYVLDMRGHRDFNRQGDSAHRILGEAQMDRVLHWLESDEVKQAKAVFIVSPVPVVHVDEFVVNSLDLAAIGLADDLRDEWGHKSNWYERDRLLEAVFKLSHGKKKRVCFLSGDVHIGAGFELSRPGYGDARVYQLTSSAITYYLGGVKKKLLELIVKERGTLGARDNLPEDKKTRFRTLHKTLTSNNFGIVNWRDDGGEGRLTWDLYGHSDDDDVVIKLKRVEL